MEPGNSEEISKRLLESFKAGFPHLTIEVAWESHAKPLGAWAATIRDRSTGKPVAKGIRRDPAKAIQSAVGAIPEEFRRDR